MGDGKTCEELDDWKKGMEETKACLGNICISKQRHPPKKKLYRVLLHQSQIFHVLTYIFCFKDTSNLYIY